MILDFRNCPGCCPFLGPYYVGMGDLKDLDGIRTIPSPFGGNGIGLTVFYEILSGLGARTDEVLVRSAPPTV